MQSRDGAQQRRLTGAVGANHRQDLTGLDTQRDVVDGAELSVMHREFGDLEQGPSLIRLGDRVAHETPLSLMMRPPR